MSEHRRDQYAEADVQVIAKALFDVLPVVPEWGQDNRTIACHLLDNGIGPRAALSPILVCCDEQHAKKVALLERQIARLTERLSEAQAPAQGGN